MRFCIGGEYQQVGGGVPSAALTGVNLVRIHAVRVLPGGPADGTVCGKPYNRLEAAADWESHLARVGGMRCATCEVGTDSER
jgi:hypothetical protein